MSHFTPAQLLVIRAAILAETDPVLVQFRTDGALGAVAEFFNGESAFIAWKTKVPLAQVGDNFVGTDVSGLSTANATRLQLIADYSQAGVNPSLADRRAMFDDVFGAAGAATKAKLLVLWKRPARRIEKVFATGTGTDLAPGLLVYEGTLNVNDVVDALR